MQNIKFDQEEGQPTWETYNLTGMFVVSSALTNVQPSDCPLDHYSVCESSVAVCNQASSIQTTDRFRVERNDSGDYLHLNRDPLASSAFTLAASTKSGVTSTYAFNVQICGGENISVDESYFRLRNGVFQVSMSLDQE